MVMRPIYYCCLFILLSSVNYAAETYTESQLFANFKNENSCWYGTEDEMTNESEKIIDFLKKFSTELKSNTPDFWKEVNDKVKERFPSFDFSTCEGETVESEISVTNKKKADIWEQNNPWFGENEEMTNYAIEIHLELMDSGIDLDSDAYYTNIDEKMRNKFPHYFSQSVVFLLLLFLFGVVSFHFLGPMGISPLVHHGALTLRFRANNNSP